MYEVIKKERKIRSTRLLKVYNNPQDDKKNHVKPKTDCTCTRAIKNNIYKVTLYFLHDIIILNFCMDTYNITDASFF